jgi:23S rRNA pseudouridine2605 synthase
LKNSKLLHMAQGFKKFMGKGDSGAKKKERIRQEKKKARQETKEYFEKKKQEAREARAQGQAGGFQSERGRKEYGEKKASGSTPHAARGKAQSFKPKAESQRPNTNTGKAASFKPQAASNTSQKPKAESHKPNTNTGKAASFKPQAAGNAGHKPKAESQRLNTNTGKAASFKPQAAGNAGHKPNANTGKVAANAKAPAGKADAQTQAAPAGAMPLNKFIAHAGICSRRDAADVVKSGKVIVNGQKILEPGHKVSDKDDIKVNGKKLFLRRNLVYILLNKPKDFLTTTEDPQGRKTVMDIIRNATEERVYPIGRLDGTPPGYCYLPTMASWRRNYRTPAMK